MYSADMHNIINLINRRKKHAMQHCRWISMQFGEEKIVFVLRKCVFLMFPKYDLVTLALRIPLPPQWCRLTHRIYHCSHISKTYTQYLHATWRRFGFRQPSERRGARGGGIWFGPALSSYLNWNQRGWVNRCENGCSTQRGSIAVW